MKVDGAAVAAASTLRPELDAAIGDRIDGQPRSLFAVRTVVPTKAVVLRPLAGEPRLYVALGAVRSVLCAASLELRTGRQAANSFVYKF